MGLDSGMRGRAWAPCASTRRSAGAPPLRRSPPTARVRTKSRPTHARQRTPKQAILTPRCAPSTVRQDRLLDGFEGKLTPKKWAAIGKCSIPAAQRDINELIERNVLRRNPGGSKHTSYDLVIAP